MVRDAEGLFGETVKLAWGLAHGLWKVGIGTVLDWAWFSLTVPTLFR